MHKQFGFTVLSLVLVAACGQSEGGETVQAAQEGVASGATGVGIMAPLGLDLSEQGYAADDVTIFIRSFDPMACSMPTAPDLFSGATGFEWSIVLLLPAADIHVGKTFRFAGNECEGSDCVLGSADSIGGQGGPAGEWLGSGLRCDDDSYDLPALGEIVAVGDDTITVEISELCFTDHGPISEDFADDPGDDVIHRVEGRFEISICSEPAAPAN